MSQQLESDILAVVCEIPYIKEAMKDHITYKMKGFFSIFVFHCRQKFKILFEHLSWF